MYIRSLNYVNVGPIKNVKIDTSFDEKGNPKPLVIVGENGTGKSILLSNIVDMFYEFAGKIYNNVRVSANGGGYSYYKTISTSEINTSNKFLCAHILCEDGEKCFEYIFKSGEKNFEDYKIEYNPTVSSEMNWNEEKNYKNNNFDSSGRKDLFDKNVICYFNPERYEKPIWLGEGYHIVAEKEHLEIKNNFTGTLYNSITIHDMATINLKWILDVITDSRPDCLITQNQFQPCFDSSDRALNVFQSIQAKNGIEKIMSEILGEEVSFRLESRAYKSQRLRIKNKIDSRIKSNSFMALSTGQLALFNMFASIIRYADFNNSIKSVALNEIEGIVLVDEVELHLHSKLQREVLGKLMKLFPKVQFIVTTHSPLFLLGMREFYGDDGFDVVEMPSGNLISVEEFAEFEKIYEYYKKTDKYEEDFKKAILSLSKTENKALVITEGATDWKHIKAALKNLKNRLGNEWLVELESKIEFMEYEPKNSILESSLKLDMGESVLRGMAKHLSIISREQKIILIADRDVSIAVKELGNSNDCNEIKRWGNNVYSFLLPIPDERMSTPEICIEHLYNDTDIKSDVMCEDGKLRRLYLANEFDSFGVGESNGMICEKKFKDSRQSIAIIEGSAGEKVFDFCNRSDKDNRALSKMKFAEYALGEGNDKLDFKNFMSVFEKIKLIIEE